MSEYKLVKASEDNCELLYKWTNEEEVRKNSFNTDKINYEDHVKWFMGKLNSLEIFIYIFKKNEEPIGVMRLEKIDEESMLINFSIDCKYRGLGYATKLLKLIKVQFEEYILVGKVKKDNIGSIKAFRKSGYIMTEELDKIIFYSKKNSKEVR